MDVVLKESKLMYMHIYIAYIKGSIYQLTYILYYLYT